MQTNSSPLHRGIRAGSAPQERGCRSTIRAALCRAEHRAGEGARRPTGRGGFSLIEVVIALGVISFAFVALFGMLPVGLNAFNNSIDSTTDAQIAQSIMSQMRQAKFSQLYAQYNDTAGITNPSFFKTYGQYYTAPQGYPAYYYDDQGNPAVASGTSNPQLQPPPQGYIYCAGVQVYYDAWNVSGGVPTAPPFNLQPETSTLTSASVNATSPQPVATVIITISKFSSPLTARVYTGYIGNNGF